jgi:hypothetical protein
VEIAEILKDRQLTEWFVQDKLCREAAFNMIHALVTQLEEVFSSPISRGILPATVRVGTIADTKLLRVRLTSGKSVIVDLVTHAVTPIFPPDFEPRSLFVSNHTIDRGSVGAAAMNFMVAGGWLANICWGVFHDTWNAAKDGARKMGWWKEIVRFSKIANFNHGPFRSGAWRRLKEALLYRWVSLTDPTTPSFREAAVKTAAMCGQTVTTEQEFMHWYKRATLLPSCYESGPILKFSRLRSRALGART